MAQKEFIIEFQFLWQRANSCMLSCTHCEDIIYGKGYAMSYMISFGDSMKITPTDIVLCESCYDGYEDE